MSDSEKDSARDTGGTRHGRPAETEPGTASETWQAEGDPADPDLDPAARTRLLLGQAALDRLAASTVMVVGVGGVGGSCVEALARGGVGHLVLVDPDVVVPSNLNRQAVAFLDTVGMPKVEAARRLVAAVAPQAEVEGVARRILPDDVPGLLDVRPDFVIDAQDTVATKLALATGCEGRGIPYVSAMGTGNKLRPELFEFADIYETSVCPLCKAVRKRARELGIGHMTVLYSREVPRKAPAHGADPDGTGAARTVGTASWVPPAAGLMLAGYVVQKLTGLE